MSTRERRRQDTSSRRLGNRLEENGSRDHLDSLLDDAQHLLDAADEAISRVLSSDSEAFLKATRQQGGE